jgi:hypothetical protein
MRTPEELFQDGRIIGQDGKLPDGPMLIRAAVRAVVQECIHMTELAQESGRDPTVDMELHFKEYLRD